MLQCYDMLWWHEMYDDMIRDDDISCYNDMYVWDAMLHYDMNMFGNEMYDIPLCVAMSSFLMHSS